MARNSFRRERGGARSSKKIHYKSRTKIPRAKAGVGPHYKAEHSFAVCKKCRSVYQKKAWRHGQGVISLDEARKLRVSIALCPADQMIERKLYEGELTIEGFSGKSTNELLRLIRAYGDRAFKRDCQHRVIGVERQKGGRIRVTTTENQLAAKLAKKIKDVFNTVTVRTSYSKEPHEVERVYLKFVKNSE